MKILKGFQVTFIHSYRLCFLILIESKESVIILHRQASVEIFKEMHLSFLLEDKTFYKSLYWFQIKFVTKRRLNSWSASVLFSVWTIWWGLTGSNNNWSLQSGPKTHKKLAVSFSLIYTLRTQGKVATLYKIFLILFLVLSRVPC